MTARALLDDLEAAGIRLALAGDDLRAVTAPGADLDPWRASIRENKPDLLAELRLRARIIAAVTCDSALFNRSVFDWLMDQWEEGEP